MSTNTSHLEKQVHLLNQQYEAALERGEEFSVLREIKDKLHQLKDQIAANGNGHASLQDVGDNSE